MSARREALSAERRALLARWSQAGAAGAAGETIPRRAAGGDRLPVSDAQRRLWAAEQAYAGRVPFDMAHTYAARLRGRLRPDALEWALARVVERHELLRTTFPGDDGEPIQRIHPDLTPPLTTADLAGVPDREARLLAMLVEQGRRPFDLAAGPPLRACLLRLGADDHVLGLTLHRIAGDGPSLEVLMHDLSVLHDARLAGTEPALDPLPLQFGDYALWEAERAGAGRLQADLAFWRGRLAGAPELLPLPTDRPRPDERRFRGAEPRFALPERLRLAIHAHAREARTSPAVVMRAALAALLAGLSGSRDVVIGAPITGRARPELRPLVGVFANILPLRFDLTDDPTFERLVAGSRQTALEASAHQELPFEALVDDLGLRRSGRWHPVFQVMFSFQKAPLRPPALAGLAVEPLHVHTGTSTLDLWLLVIAGGASPGLLLEYDTDLFEAGSARRFVDRYLAVLERGMAAPGTRLSRLT